MRPGRHSPDRASNSLEHRGGRRAFFAGTQEAVLRPQAPLIELSCACVAIPPERREQLPGQAREAAVRAVKRAFSSNPIQHLLSVVRPQLLTIPAFEERVRELYPGCVTRDEFVRNSVRRLAPFGFCRQTSIPVICLCRDELCQPLFRKIEEAWTTPGGAGAFDLSGLAGIGGLLSGGITAFAAAEGHSPLAGDGRERYVFFAFLHVAVGEDGTVGACTRAGRCRPSHACGALCAIQARYAQGLMNERPALDLEDVEESLLAQLVFERLGPRPPAPPPRPRRDHPRRRRGPGRAAGAPDRGVDGGGRGACDYAVLTGVEVHGPHSVDLVYPMLAYAVVAGARHDL
eukprot:tig00021795_g23525.t1